MSSTKNNNKKNNKVLCIFLFFISIILIILGSGLSYLGNSKIILSKTISKVSNNIKDTLKTEENLIGENYSVKSDIKFDIKSNYLTKLTETDPTYQVFYKLMSNLNATKTTINYTQNKDEKTLFLDYSSSLNNQELVKGKYLIENNTEYYYVNGITKNYINNGNNNYFENLNSQTTQKDNLIYIYDLVISSLNNNIKEEYIQKTTKNNETKITLTLDSNNLYELSTNILNDLKNDKLASEILSNYNKDFKKQKIKKDTFKNKVIKLDIYTDSIIYKPKKYELLMKDTNTTKLIYELGNNNDQLTIFSNNEKELSAKITYKANSSDITIYDTKDKKIGTLNLSKEKNKKNIKASINIDDTKIVAAIDNENTNIKKKKSYSNKTKLSINATNNKESLIDLKIDIISAYSNDAKINEDVSKSILASSLTTSEKELLNNKPTSILETLMK